MSATNYESVAGHRQLIGGGIKRELGEDEEGAAIREAREEAWLRVGRRQLEDVPFGIAVDQAERGNFGVHVFSIRLNILQELWLRLARGAKVVDGNDSLRGLRTRDRDIVVLSRETGVVK